MTATLPPNVAPLRDRFNSAVEGLLSLTNEIEDHLRHLEARQDWWNRLNEEVLRNINATRDRIDLNVGGRLYSTTKDTLMRWEGTYFSALLGSGHWEPCEDGAYFIDRDPELFSRVMESLRSGEVVDRDGLSEKRQHKLRVECDYYQLPKTVIPIPLTTLRWDAHRCGGYLTLSDNNCVVTKTAGGNEWNAAVMASTPDVASFKVRLVSGGLGRKAMVGYVRASAFQPSGSNYNRSGWFLCCHSGTLYSGFGDSSRIYCDRVQQDDILEVHLHKAEGLIRFVVNGKNKGVAFREVDCHNEPLHPCTDICDLGTSLAFED